MKLIIEISDERYKEIVESNKPVFIYRSDVEKVLANGIKLPKGHGRLIDADKLTESILCQTFGLRSVDIDNAPTIIEADTESEDKNEQN